MSQLRNDFDKDELNRWFCFNYTCWFCGRSNADCFHHILGRTSNSILNAAPINNNECHLPSHGELVKKENAIRLLEKTYKYLMSQDYKLKDKDREFISKNCKYYQEILKHGN